MLRKYQCHRQAHSLMCFDLLEKGRTALEGYQNASETHLTTSPTAQLQRKLSRRVRLKVSRSLSWRILNWRGTQSQHSLNLQRKCRRHSMTGSQSKKRPKSGTPLINTSRTPRERSSATRGLQRRIWRTMEATSLVSYWRQAYIMPYTRMWGTTHLISGTEDAAEPSNCSIDEPGRLWCWIAWVATASHTRSHEHEPSSPSRSWRHRNVQWRRVANGTARTYLHC